MFDHLFRKDDPYSIGADGTLTLSPTFARSNDVRRLHNRRASLRGAAEMLLSSIEAERRQFSTEEDAVFKALTAETERVSTSIRVAELDRERDRDVRPKHDFDGLGEIADPGASPRSSSALRGGRRFAEMFPDTPRSMAGWRDPDEFYSTLAHGLSDPRLLASAHGESSGADGGFAVPTEVTGRWLDASLPSEIVRSRATVEGMKSETKRVWGFRASSAAAGGPISGLVPQWLAENAEIDEKKGELRSILLNARKLGLLAAASNELVADGTSFAEQLDKAMVAAIGWGMDLAFLTGNGAGKPLGALNAPSTIEVGKETGQAAATVLYQNLVKMFGRLHPGLVADSIWVANSTAIPQLLTLTLPIGTGGAHIPAMTQADGGFSILTRPVVFSEKVPAVGSRGDVMLAAFSQYVIGMRADARLDRSAHAGFSRDQEYFRAILRVDGQPTWDSVYTPLNGDTLSWCVVLGARA